MLGSNSRKRIYAYPRNIYAYLCRCHTDETLEKLGETVNRSHSSILYASEVIARKMETDSRVRHEVSFLSKELEEMKK
jgi:chromosomal replication initiator protein